MIHDGPTSEDTIVYVEFEEGSADGSTEGSPNDADE
jgi:hypothetical protein